MADRVERAAVVCVLREARGEFLTPGMICAKLGIAHGVTGDGWQNACEVIWHLSRLYELGHLETNNRSGFALPLPREDAA